MAAAARQLAWASLAVRNEARRWRLLAEAIPDAPIRRDALNSLGRKRTHTDGAALFSILTPHRSPELLRVLVAYEIMCDFLDSASERVVRARRENGAQLHLALVDAFDPRRALSDYYLHHPWGNDGGYLRLLVVACRCGCRSLPSYERVRSLVVAEALRGSVLAVNHELDPVRRGVDLREWVLREHAQVSEMMWFELTGAASATLTTHALLALAAMPEVDGQRACRVQRAYLWINLLTTMLDSFVDQLEDAVNRDHSYVAHYPNGRAAVGRIQRLICRSLAEALALESGERHAVIVSCMIAMYLSKDSTRSPELRQRSAALAALGGSLTRLLLPVLRMWRIAYRLSSC